MSEKARLREKLAFELAARMEAESLLHRTLGALLRAERSTSPEVKVARMVDTRKMLSRALGMEEEE